MAKQRKKEGEKAKRKSASASTSGTTGRRNTKKATKKQHGPLRLKTSLNDKEIEELINRVEELEEILSRVNVQVLLDNNAVHDDDVEDIVFSKVRVVQILKLLGARKVASKQNIRPERPWRKYWS